MDTNEKAAEAESLRKRVEERAYAIWEGEGRPAGRHLDHWLQAEVETASSAGSGPTAGAEEGSAAASDPEAKAPSKKR